MSTPVDIDGSRGEGGGQILRTSLALSLITGRPITMRNIRAGRAKPGLRRQHVACVDAAVKLCGGTVHGAKVDSKYLELTPGPIRGGELAIDIGTAGSTTLVVQTILVPAIVGGHGLRATIRGGTHNPMAPPFEFLERVFLPRLREMGARVTLALDQYGFVGDVRGPLGQLTLEIRPGALRPIEILEAAPSAQLHATAPALAAPHARGGSRSSRWCGTNSRPRAASSRVTDAAIGNLLAIEVGPGHGRSRASARRAYAPSSWLPAYDAAAAYLAANVGRRAPRRISSCCRSRSPGVAGSAAHRSRCMRPPTSRPSGCSSTCRSASSPRAMP
ncbi:MAG: RNA 3'-terminal phosphate cyclase [Myxococcales bacterium]|nr:RNA 3'-terminal phosphate cyclase [Myxococcales bacterium]